jgi:hypothetical protein
MSDTGWHQWFSIDMPGLFAIIFRPIIGIVRLCPLQNGNLLSFLLFLYHPHRESVKSLLWNFGLVVKSDTQFTY